MICPCCDSDDIYIIETRGDRRRRKCERCKTRWTTYEVPAERLEKLERLEQAVADVMGIELPKRPPPTLDEWRPTAEQLAQWEAERGERDKRNKQDEELERRERLRKQYDEERKARGW